MPSSVVTSFKFEFKPIIFYKKKVQWMKKFVVHCNVELNNQQDLTERDSQGQNVVVVG